MQKLNFYGLLSKSSNVISNVGYAFDDKQMSAYMLKELTKVVDEVPEERKNYVIESIRDNFIVRIGSLDMESHNLENDFATLVDLKDFHIERESKDNNE